MISPLSETHQSSDWSAPSVPLATSHNTASPSTNAQNTNSINNISSLNIDQSHSTVQPKKKSNTSCKPLQYWSSLSPITRGILLGALTNCLVLVIVLPIWLTKSSAKRTTTFAPINVPLLRWNTTGITVAGVTGVSGTASNQLQTPWDLALDWSNTLYVTDRYNNRIQKLPMGAKSGTTVAGQINGTSGSAADQLSQPTGIYVNANGNIYLSDTNNNRIQYWTNGAISGVTVIGNGTAGVANNLLYNPYEIWRDENSGTFYIADSYNHRIMRFDSNALSGNIIAGNNLAGTSTSQLSYPYAFYFDSLTNSLLIANAGGNNIVRWPIGASNWTLVAGSGIGSSGSAATLLSGPTDITLDPMGNVYVVDMGNHRIQFFSSGQSSGVTIAGSEVGISGNNATLLFSPSSLILDNQLNLYIVDQNNNRVQKFVRY